MFKQSLKFLLLFLSFNLSVFANDTIKIEYKNLHHLKTPETAELYEMIEFLGLQYSKIIISGNIKGKKFVSLMHKVMDKHDSINIFEIPRFVMKSDTLTIDVKAFRFDDNKVKINLRYSGIEANGVNITYRKTFTNDIEMATAYTLLETPLGKILTNDNQYYYLTTSNPFPIIAYTRGIALPELNITSYTCGLIETCLHPNLWNEKFKELQDYIYFEIKFIE